MAIDVSRPQAWQHIQQGDIVLYRNQGLIASAIVFFDGGPYSHSGMALGEQSVGEAIARGVVTRSYPDSFAHTRFAHAYRVRTPADLNPVLTVARKYLGQNQRYAFEQLLLLAFLTTFRRTMNFGNPLASRLLRLALDAGATVLYSWAKQAAGGLIREPMTCSEFVYRAYVEAVPGNDDPYELQIVPHAKRHEGSGRERLEREAESGSFVRYFADSAGGLFSVGARRAGPLTAEALARELPDPGDTLQRLADALKGYMEGEGVHLPADDAGELVPTGSDDEKHLRTLSALETGHSETKDDFDGAAAALARFGAAGELYLASTNRKSQNPLPASVPSWVQALFQVRADWVTPRDLLTSPSLVCR